MLHRRVVVWFVLAITFFSSAVPSNAQKDQDGLLPIGPDGKALNLDFETGTLKDWTAEGDAFKNQPIKGDTVFGRRKDMKSQHQGQYWIGGYERHGDKPEGTLTSIPFKVTRPWASFLVGGGPWPTTGVELVRKDTGQVFFRASGIEEENLRRVVVDLKLHAEKEIFIRVVDKHSGHWGHVNFDDFRLHAAQPNFPPRPTPQGPQSLDTFKFAGLPPKKAAEAMTVPEGFTVKLFAGEPDVHQPIAFCFDDRGRIWVAEAYVYPKRLPYMTPLLPEKDKKAGDRILIFEDVDGDGHFDKKTVFMEGLNLVSGIEYGFGGLYIGAAPYLMHVPIKDGADKPAGPPKILLDGWGWQDTHETLNSFIWGPDGWLYGCHGVFTHSLVGKPGTPNAKRQAINAGVWRYHPTRHVFEVFAHGTSNPWGLDFDEHGQAFCEACVIPHAFHIIQDGRYHRQAGQHFNPYTYADIQTIADHRHYLGATPHAGNNKSDSAGGGHAHCGLMIYQGGSWPKEYHGKMFMGNIHGRRLNMDILKPKGSGYVASHGPDFLLANDAYARFINMRYGPDGNVYVIDWYDKQACHTKDTKIWDRTNGRIYKICYRGAKALKQVDLRKMKDNELIDLQSHENDWYVRHARRVLQERAHAKQLSVQARAQVGRGLTSPNDLRRLRELWLMHATSSPKEEISRLCLGDRSPLVRAWAIQLLLEDSDTSAELAAQLARMAKHDASPVVRLYLASALQRLNYPQRTEILAAGLLAHVEDAGDHNLPLMYWYAIEPVAESDKLRELLLRVIEKRCEIPQVLPLLVRRCCSMGSDEAIDDVVALLSRTPDLTKQRLMLHAIRDGLKGRPKVPMPNHWPDAVEKQLASSKDSEVRSLTMALGLKFGDQGAAAELRRVLASVDAPAASRHDALAALVEARDKELPSLLHKLLGDAVIRGPGLRGLAAFDEPKTPARILEVYPSLSLAEKRDALATLGSRVSYAKTLLDAVAAKKVAVSEVSADLVRQLRNLQSKELNQRITDLWGIVRDTPADRAKAIAQYKKLLAKPGKAPPDLSLGRALYAKTCQQCHVLFGAGGNVGPDITGASRADLNYLLENVLDPGAVIQKEYTVTFIEMTDGRNIQGIVKGETPAALTVVTANETLTLPRKDIATQKPTIISMMPDDQLKPFTDVEIRALFAYLQSPTQVPILATSENAKEFFNGKDLTGWDGDPKLWKVVNGEIVGLSPGLKKNEFLRSQLLAGDFRLTLKVQLVPNSGNSGIQFRGEVLDGGDVKGYQADIGAGWWGKLYEEHGRGLLWKDSGEKHVKAAEWNDYEIVAAGSRIKTYINGKLCADLDDPKGARRGIFALQLHSGAAMEVRFKELRLELK
jgi:putative membrane-bound dehydrogenase-like protein